MSAATPQPSACTSPSTEPVAWLHDAGPLFDKLELDDVRLHCRYMGLANFADSLDDRLHAIRYLLQQRLISTECQHKAAREAFSKVDLL